MYRSVFQMSVVWNVSHTCIKFSGQLTEGFLTIKMPDIVIPYQKSAVNWNAVLEFFASYRPQAPPEVFWLPKQCSLWCSYRLKCQISRGQLGSLRTFSGFPFRFRLSCPCPGQLNKEIWGSLDLSLVMAWKVTDAKDLPEKRAYCSGLLFMFTGSTQTPMLSFPVSLIRVCVCVYTKFYPTLCNPMPCSPPGSSDHEVFQVRILECTAISCSSVSSQPRDQTHVSCISCTGSWVLSH